MYHDTKFGEKMFGGLEDIRWTNIDISTLHYDLDFECSDPFFFSPQNTLAYADVLSD